MPSTTIGTRLRTAALFAVFAVPLACGGRKKTTAQPEPIESIKSEVAIVVQNNNFLDIRVYIIRRGETVRVGIAPGLKTTSFVVIVPALGADSDLRLRAIPIGQNATFVTDRLLVRPGQTIQLTLQPNLSQSNFAVY